MICFARGTAKAAFGAIRSRHASSLPRAPRGLNGLQLVQVLLQKSLFCRPDSRGNSNGRFCRPLQKPLGQNAIFIGFFGDPDRTRNLNLPL